MNPVIVIAAAVPLAYLAIGVGGVAIGIMLTLIKK